jgi:hypothetical protein
VPPKEAKSALSPGTRDLGLNRQRIGVGERVTYNYSTVLVTDVFPWVVSSVLALGGF